MKKVKLKYQNVMSIITAILLKSSRGKIKVKSFLESGAYKEAHVWLFEVHGA